MQATIDRLNFEMQDARRDLDYLNREIEHLQEQKRTAYQQYYQAKGQLKQLTEKSMFYSPEPEPGHFANPALKARLAALNEYNRKISHIRTNGIKDSAGFPDRTTERKLISIYTQAITKLGRADKLFLIERIVEDTRKEVGKATNYSAAA